MSANRRFVLATANPDKVVEIAAIMGHEVELIPRPTEVPDVVEDAETLLGNALLKARALVEATGLAAVADDTGLEVDALGGAPGVYSARYAGEQATYQDNVLKLLSELTEVPAPRTARFKTVAVACWPDGAELHCEGVIEGTIATAQQGAGGFGYDPVFLPQGGGGRSFAEMSTEEKNALSHRGRAFRSLAGKLNS